MTLIIQTKDTEEPIFQTEDACIAPNVGEYIMVDNAWYEVVGRNFSFRHLSAIDDNVCAIFAEPLYTKQD